MVELTRREFIRRNRYESLRSPARNDTVEKCAHALRPRDRVLMHDLIVSVIGVHRINDLVSVTTEYNTVCLRASDRVALWRCDH